MDNSVVIGNDQSQKKEIQEHQPPWHIRALIKIDIFSFLPTPKTNPVSSRKSIQGSLLLLGIFLGYLIFTFIGQCLTDFLDFVTNNSPMINQYYSPLPLEAIYMPDVAFAFFFGEPFQYTVNEPTIFQFQYQQVTKYQDVEQPDLVTNIELELCKPDWIENLNFTLLCPKIKGTMIGALYQTSLFSYPRIIVTYCQQNENVTCVSQTELSQIAAGGRILLYVKDDSINFDMTTGQALPNIPFQVMQYFLMPGFYPRGEIYFLQQSYTISPDYFWRFRTKYMNFITLESYNTWLTNVSVYNPYDAIQIYFRTDQHQQLTFLHYLTTLNLISMWGAFWGVLFSAFAAYFLSHNQEQFYKANKEWENLGSRIGVKRPKDTIHWEDEEEKNNHNTLIFEAKGDNEADGKNINLDQSNLDNQ